jgi:hypothetical protein
MAVKQAENLLRKLSALSALDLKTIMLVLARMCFVGRGLAPAETNG